MFSLPSMFTLDLHLLLTLLTNMFTPSVTNMFTPVSYGYNLKPQPNQFDQTKSDNMLPRSRYSTIPTTY